MKTERAPRRRVAPSLLSALSVLVLGTWGHPALSATASDARCDQPIDTPSLSIADDRRIPLKVIDHPAARTTAADDISLDDTVDEGSAETAAAPTGPRVDIMLRRIFDEARARQPNLAEPEQTGDLSAPLVVDKSENVEEQAAGLESDPVDSLAELPGFSADELHRYRQQMYRTDI